MAIEEVGQNLSKGEAKGMVLTVGKQEFSIEIPDKEADAIHSSEFP